MHGCAGVDAEATHQELVRLPAAELGDVFRRHELFRNSRPGGRRAVLTATDMSGLDLTGWDLSHADFTGVPRVSPLEKTLFACDELAGFLTACAYVKPGRSIQEVETASVKKKLKDKAFARAVNRDDIVNGAAQLGVDLDQHISFCIEAMRARAPELGLAAITG